jgi:1-acyl-sn-glycerol-3-phosphate acyltransferase
VGPHTSNTDFIMGLAFRSVAGISHARFLAKDTLFKWPFGFLFRKAGGIPVFRNTNNNLVDQVVDYFKKNQKFVLALSPEGTRKKTEKLKTGFYYIARMADIPIVMAGFDYKNKNLVISPPFKTTENMEADFNNIISFFAPLQGKNINNGMGHYKSALNSPSQ